MHNQTELYRKHFLRRVVAVILLLCYVAVLPVQAEALYTNDRTGYQVILEDDADLLDAEQEQTLLETMKKITEF